ncbi:hypothetical protein P3S67_022602 [Capsicum chacoense]
MGDYNAIHKVEHRLIGSNVQEAELKDFKSFLIENNMSVLRAMGREFSWTNGHTYTMIDWALVNVSWMFDMPTSEVILLDPGYSDHSPLSLSFPKDDTSKAKPFKFINHLAQHENFQEIVMRAWNQRHRGGKMYDSHMRQPSQPKDVIDLEKKVKKNLEKWLNVEESIVRQKSRLQ